jgi:hypothetical protein
MIITQKINKVNKLFDNVDYRTLSAVQEDPAENEVGSFSLKQGGVMQRGTNKRPT